MGGMAIVAVGRCFGRHSFGDGGLDRRMKVKAFVPYIWVGHKRGDTAEIESKRNSFMEEKHNTFYKPPQW